MPTKSKAAPRSTPRSRGAGMGLLGMQERAVLHGGELTIDSGAGAGTVIRATIPLHCVAPRASGAVA